MLSKLTSFFRKNKNIGAKKKTLYIHIGMGKTGTTALQEFFWGNKDILLEEHGISYPEYGAVSCAHHLLSPHIPTFLAVDWKYLKPEEWCPELTKLDADKILISSELIAWASPEIVSEFCNEVAKWFDVKVVIYLRRQDNLIMAGYNQQIKAGTQKKDIHDVLEHQIARFNYLEKLAPWLKSLGKLNLIVIPYEKQQFYNDDIRYDFIFRVFGINDFARLKLTKNNSNPRLSYVAMEYKRWINNIFPDTKISGKFNSILLEYSAKTDDTSTSIYSNSSVLTPSERLRILDECKIINQKIAKYYLRRCDGKLFYDEPPKLNKSYENRVINKDEFQKLTEYIRTNSSDLYTLIDEVLISNLE